MAEQIKAVIKLRRGSEPERLATSVQEGEIVYSTNKKRVYVGDGATNGGNLVGNKTFFTDNVSNLTLATQGDFWYNTSTNILYSLTGSDSVGFNSYRRMSQLPDNSTIEFNSNGLFSVKSSALNFYPKDGGKIGGDIDMDGTYNIINLKDPTSPKHPVTLGYFDTKFGDINTKINQLSSSSDNKFVKKEGDTMTGKLTIQTAESVALDLKKNLTLNDNLIERFSPKIKTITASTYTLTQADNGCILCFEPTAVGNIVVTVPKLSVGFNAMFVQMKTDTVYVLPSDNTVLVLQLDSNQAIRKQYGVANIVCIKDSTYILSGDLT
jgi:hypothetical protein